MVVNINFGYLGTAHFFMREVGLVGFGGGATQKKLA